MQTANIFTYVKSRIASRCPWNIFKLFMFDCQYFTTPLLSPVTIQLSLCDHFIARTAESWACKIVSKLNVRPFHNVNSPLDEPVMRRRPSGVHYILTKLVSKEYFHRVHEANAYPNNIHGTTDFVCRGVNEFSRYRVDRIVWVCCGRQ